MQEQSDQPTSSSYEIRPDALLHGIYVPSRVDNNSRRLSTRVYSLSESWNIKAPPLSPRGKQVWSVKMEVSCHGWKN